MRISLNNIIHSGYKSPKGEVTVYCNPNIPDIAAKLTEVQHKLDQQGIKSTIQYNQPQATLDLTYESRY